MARCKSFLRWQTWSSMLLLPVILFWATNVCCQKTTREKTMTDSFYTTSPDDPVKLDATPVNIKPVATPAAIPRAAPPPGGGGSPRPFVNDQLNSRLARALPAGEWKVRRRQDVADGLRPSFVLQTNDRILAQGIDRWQLFDLDGKPLATDRLGASPVFIDTAHPLFYLADENGYVAAHRLSGGGEEFVFHAYFGNDFQRVLLSRRGRRMLIVSVERPVDPHGQHQPNLSVVEVQDLGEPPQTNADRILRSNKRETYLMRKTVLLQAALRDDTLVLATQDRVYLADLNLKIHAVLQAEFTPLAMSLDEAGRIYLIVNERGRPALWVLTPQGERLGSFVFPPDMEVAALPPVVGYDHRAFIIGTDRLLSVNPNGKLAWARGGRVAGATVTADDQLLVSDGSELAAYDADGKRRILYDFRDEVLSTPPVLTAGGELIVASPNHLFVLSPQAAEQKR